MAKTAEVERMELLEAERKHSLRLDCRQMCLVAFRDMRRLSRYLAEILGRQRSGLTWIFTTVFYTLHSYTN